jgi:integrase
VPHPLHQLTQAGTVVGRELIPGVTVVENQAQLSNGELYLKDPKSAAGRRAVPVPDDLLDELKEHLAEYAEPGEDGRVFIGPMGGRLRRQNFRKIWIKALATSGVRPVHFHDLRPITAGSSR